MKKVYFAVSQFTVLLALLFFAQLTFGQQNSPFVSLQNPIPINFSDEKLQVEELGMEFDFGNNHFNYIFISKEGWMSFNKEARSLNQVSKLTNENTLIAPFVLLRDNKPAQNLQVSYKKGFVNHEYTFVVEWKNENFAFQAHLFKEGRIEFSYADISSITQYQATCGVINGNKAEGFFPQKVDKDINKIAINQLTSHKFFVQGQRETSVVSQNSRAVFASDYVYSASTGTYTGLTGGNLNSVEGDSKISAPINLGFTFNYCGTNYTQAVISSNGWLTFDLTIPNSRTTNDLNGSTYAPKDIIAPLWDDLDGTSTGRARYGTSGAVGSRVFTMEWARWEWNYFANADVISFQAKLYEADNHIEFIYKRGGTAINSGSASIGIMDATGTFSSVLGSGANPGVSTVTETTNISSKPANGQIYRFDPPVACATPTAQPTTLSLTPVGAFQINGSFSASTPAADGYLIVRSTNTTLSANPTNATVYTTGDALGGGTVVQASTTTTFSSTCLAQNTQYYYFIFAYNSACSGGPIYLTTVSTPAIAPLSGNATTGFAVADKTLPYSQNFDTNDGWVYGAGGTWERGNQTNDTFGPPSGHSGNTVAATNLNAKYANNIDDYLLTPTFDLSGTVGPIVSFWMDMESESGLDGGTIQIQVNGCNWTTVVMTDPAYSGLIPNDSDVDGLQNLEDGWAGTQPAGEWAQVKIDLFSITTPGINNITNADIVQVRYWFGTDGSVTYPGWYVDDFKCYDPTPCTEPTSQATGLNLTPNYTSINGSFSASVPPADEYLVVISIDPTLSPADLPIDGTIYAVGAALGDGTVVQSSSLTTFNATALSMSTQYYIFVFSYNTTACAGRNYLTISPLSGNATTLNCSTGTLPYFENFDAVTTPNLPACWAIEDNSAPNDDWYTTTSYNNTAPNCMSISYDFSNPLDDWAFSPGFPLIAGTTYTLEFYYRSRSSSWTEKLDVYYGTAQASASMATQLFTDPALGNTTYQKVSVNFTAPSTAVFYFGWHAYSAANKLGIAVDDVNIFEPGPPVITATTPDYLFEDKGTQMTITGSNLNNVTSVTLGGIAGTVVSSNFSTAVITFPAGNYVGSSLIYTTPIGVANATAIIKTRNIIPVDATALVTDDAHQTISSAAAGLFAWYGTTAFSAGDLPGAKTIQVLTGTYPEMVVPSPTLNTSAGNGLTFEAKPGQQVIVEANGLNYGFDVNIDYTKITGFFVQNALMDNIRSLGQNCEISYNNCTKAQLSGIRASGNTLIQHNLVHNNSSFGIYLQTATNANVSQNTMSENGGLPGAAGYTRTEDLGSGTIYNWEFFPGWTQIAYTDDDEKCVNFGTNGYPFEFDFWGTHYGANVTDSIGISSNAHFLLKGDVFGPGSTGSNSLDYVNASLSWHGENSSGTKLYGNDDFLACFWDDIYDDASGGSVRYSVEGIAPFRRLIVAWVDRIHFITSPNGVSVEIKIFESTNVIEFHYKDIQFGSASYDFGKSATIGIKKNDVVYDEYSFNTAVSTSLEGGALRWSPNPTSGTELYIASGTNITLENNVLQSLPNGLVTTFYAMQAPTGAVPAAKFNYNNFYKGTNTQMLKIGGIDYATLAAYGIIGAGNLETDPLFVNNTNNDFHIKSSATGASFHGGEWPPSTANSGTWTADNNLSGSVDAGDPIAAFNLEQPGNGSRLNIGCYGNTPQATKTTVLTGIWTGVVDTVWNVPNNWSDAIVPTGSCVTGPGSNVTIPDVSGASNNFPYISNAAEVDNLTIEANASLTILPDASLTVCGTLTNTPGIVGLFIKSDATGDGSLIHNTPGVLATVERYLQGTRYHYLSSPITNATTTNVNIMGGTNGFQFYQWDPTMEWMGMGVSPPNTIDYMPWGSAYSGPLNIGQGYAYYYYTQTLLYQGPLNVGNYSKTVNKSAITTGANVDQGWNLLGNPYGSSLDWDLVAADLPINVENAVYMFDDANASAVQANYRYYVPAAGPSPYGIGTAAASKYVPVGQGFMVRTAVDAQLVQLKTTHRAHSIQNFYRNGFINTDILRITVSANGSSDEMIIRFIEGATESFDGKLGARKLFPTTATIPQVYSITKEGTKSAINSMPKLTSSYDIPVGFTCVEGNYSFNFTQANFASAKVFLEDKLTGNVTKLETTPDYSFYHAGGQTNTRFVLHFVINTAPFVNEIIENQNIAGESKFTYTLPQNAFVDNDFADKISYSAVLSGEQTLPTWLSFNPYTKTFGISNVPEAGFYNITVTATDLFGETAEQTFSISTYGVSTTSVKTIAEMTSVYPNPNSGIFRVVSGLNKQVDIRIVNVTGKVVFIEKNTSIADKKINLSHFSNGIYFIEIQANTEIYRHKIVINK